MKFLAPEHKPGHSNSHDVLIRMSGLTAVINGYSEAAPLLSR